MVHVCALTRVHIQTVRRVLSVRGEALHGQLQLLLFPAPELPLLVGADQGFHGKSVGSRAQSCGRSPPLTHFSQIHPTGGGRGEKPTPSVQRSEAKQYQKKKKKCTRQCLQRDANSPSVQSNPNCELETLRQTFEGRLNHLGCARDRDGTTDSFDVVCRFARLSVLPLRVFLFLFLSL